MHGSSNLLRSAVWAMDSRVHCLCSRGRQHPGSCWGPWGPSTLPFLFTDLTPSAGTALGRHLFSSYLRQDCSFCEVGHRCALTSQPGKVGAAGAGKPLEGCTRVCSQHEHAVSPLCTAVELLHVLQPHLQSQCRHILRVITGGCVSGLYFISKN